ncbi:MAG TPA: M20/M25/M40 family metallo-hydrolase [Longimicrobiales bacterium]|nr:M20/M25/M40 family metallo-hydrolase [Longimicrobiales bacterium]
MTPDFDGMIRFAQELIRIPSPSGQEAEAAVRVAREMQSLAYDDVRTDDVGNVIGLIRGTGGGATVMLCSHLDVVDAGDPDAWEHAPYGGVVADGFLHGRGAMDIKGPLALQTHAAARFVEERPRGDLLVVHTVYEERAGLGISHFLETTPIRPDVVVIGEATNGDLCVGHRGRAEIVVEILGLAGHASAPERARNALDPLPAVLQSLRAFADTLGSDVVLGRSTFVPTSVEVEPASPNVIPDRVRVTVDWRVLPGVDAAGAVDAVRAHLAAVDLPAGFVVDVRFATMRQTTYTGREMERQLFTPAYRLEDTHPVVRSARSAIAAATGREPVVRPWTFATDGGHVCGRHGIPTIGYAPGEERYAHTNTERLALDQAREVFEAYPSLIRALCETKLARDA